MIRMVLRTFLVFSLLAGWDMFLLYHHPGADALHSKPVIAAYVIFEAVLYGMVFAGLGCMLGRRMKWVLVPVFWAILLFEFIETFVNAKFGMTIGGEWIILLVTSSRMEIGEFVRGTVLTSIVPVIIGFVLAILIGFWCCRWTWKCETETSRRCGSCEREGGLFKGGKNGAFLLRLAVGLILILPIKIAHSTLVKSGRKAMFASIVQDTLTTYRKQSCLKACLSPVVEGNVCIKECTPPLLGVLIIGESATRNRWGLYGYKNQTTPMISALKGEDCELIVFKDVKAAGLRTFEAMVKMFTGATDEDPLAVNPPFAAVINKAGYYSSLISAQGHWATLDCYEDLLFHSCDKRIFLGDVEGLAPGYDERTLPFLKDEIAKSTGRATLAFLHWVGSHYPYHLRYPKGVFGRQDWDDYDNTILYTDMQLGKVVSMLKETKRPSFMIYISDHGESPDSSTWRDATDKDCWEIPLVMWFSREYASKFPECIDTLRSKSTKSLKADRVSELFLIAAGIEFSPAL